MEVKPGYKQTEVGVVPDEWDVPPLREHLVQDATYGVVKAGSFQRNGIPMLRGGDIKDGSIADGQPLITPEKSAEYSRTLLRPNDVVIALVGYPGESAVVPGRLVGANISRAVGLLRPAPTLNPAFLACYLNSPNGRKEFLRPSAGSAQIVVNLGALNKLLLPLPLIEEQRAIAAALSDVDALLGGLDRLIAKKHDLKQAAMQQLLTGQNRLPGFSGAWEVKAIRNIVSTPITDGPHLTPKFLAEGIPFLSVNNLVNNRIDLQSLRYISKTDHLEFSKKCKPRKGDILFGKAASVGMVALIDTDMELNIWSPLALIRVDAPASARFVHYALQASHVHRQIKLLTNSSSQGNIGMGEIGLLEIPLPGPDEQTAIAAVLSDMDAELAALEARRDKTRDLKQAMMQELLTGKTRFI